MTQHARKELKGFLDQLKELLDQINENQEWLPDDDDLRRDLSGAAQDMVYYFAEAERALTVDAETSPIDADLKARCPQSGLVAPALRRPPRASRRRYRRHHAWLPPALLSRAGESPARVWRFLPDGTPLRAAAELRIGTLARTAGQLLRATTACSRSTIAL
jgi:hypothetical protein